MSKERERAQFCYWMARNHIGAHEQGVDHTQSTIQAAVDEALESLNVTLATLLPYESSLSIALMQDHIARMKSTPAAPPATSGELSIGQRVYDLEVLARTTNGKLHEWMDRCDIRRGELDALHKRIDSIAKAAGGGT
jgi:hypothetical protein